MKQDKLDKDLTYAIQQLSMFGYRCHQVAYGSDIPFNDVLNLIKEKLIVPLRISLSGELNFKPPFWNNQIVFVVPIKEMVGATNEEMREYVIKQLKEWVSKVGVEGIEHFLHTAFCVSIWAQPYTDLLIIKERGKINIPIIEDALKQYTVEVELTINKE